MSAGALDIILEQGATFTLAMVWTDPDDLPINLTGYTARMQVRQMPNVYEVIVELTTENGRIALGGSAGTIDLTIAAADTEALPGGEYVYDLELVSGGGIVTRLVEGACLIPAEVTRP